MKWVDSKLDVRGSLLIIFSITSYFILCKGVFEGILHFLNEDKNWTSSLYLADFIAYMFILAGFYTILRRMNKAPKSQTLEEENHKHQFYRVIILFVILVDLIVYKKLNLKISVYETKTLALILVGFVMILIDTISRRQRKKKQLLKGDR